MSVVVWSKYNCTYCDQAKAVLKQKDIVFEERKIGDGWTREELLEAAPTARTLPQIFINNQLIGGYQDLVKYLEETGYNGTGNTL